MIRSKRLLARSIGAAAVLLGLAAAPAAAAPSFEIELSRDAVEVSHSDERVDYMVEVTNNAESNVDVGAQLTCLGTPEDGMPWNGKPVHKLHFAYQWVRNGAEIPGATAKTYVAVAEDAGKALQCVVTGTVDATDPSESPSFDTVSQPPVVVEPLPAPAPPAGGSSPTIDVVGGGTAAVGKELECVPPGNWSGSPTWTFQWLSNGEPATGSVSGPSGERYLIVAADEHTMIQCQVIGSNAGGGALGISGTPITVPGGFPSGVETAPNAGRPTVLTSNFTSGPTTVEIELPGGEQTFVYKFTDGIGESEGPPAAWSCTKVPPLGAEPAKGICQSTVAVAPGKSFPPLVIATALGADAPDLAVARATVSGGGVPAAASDEDMFTFAPPIPFALTAFEAGVFDSAGNDHTQAGGHPFSGVAKFVFGKKRMLQPELGNARYAVIEHVSRNITDLPRGFVGNALAVPEWCDSVEKVADHTCPPASAVGAIRLVFNNSGGTFPIYAIEPEFGVPAQFAFSDPFKDIYVLSTRLRPAEGYGISFELTSTPVIDLFEAEVTLCAWGAKSTFSECKEGDEAGANPKPLFGNPTRCGNPPPVVRTRFNSWEHPDAFIGAEFANPPITGCEKVKFEPKIDLQPTSTQADSPTGIDVELTMPTNGLEGKDEEGNRDPEATSQAHLKRVKIAFPPGMSVNASAGHGLGSCSAAQIKLKTNLPIECPESSKFGTMTVETPILQETLVGDVYIAGQGDVGGAMIGFYVVFDSKKDGILIKIPARVDPDPATGQLIVTFDESPEAPFSKVALHFPGGPRASLLNPPKCGTYEIKSEISSWAAQDPDNPTPAETVTSTSPFQVTQGPNGGPCPSGALEANLSAGSTDPIAGATSPFVIRLHREDGSQRFSALGMKVPLGLSAYLKGIPYCPDEVIDSISPAPETGQAELENPSCPAASQIGTAAAGVGAGPTPFYANTGRLYLAGPYKGAPVSLVLVAPAVAGPLDLGSVVVRTPIYIDPETTRINAVSDPIPTNLHGLLIGIRDIRVNVDRPSFALNPTSCEAKSVDAEVTGETGEALSLSNRFQVGGCESLGFKPKIFTRLIGGTKRGAHPALRGVLLPRPGDANVGRVSVTIPRSEFLDQAHIRTICTRVQFAARQCPKGSIYGRAKAFTPLLDHPVEGPVYLRSSDNQLPDMVVAVRGPDHQPIEAAVVGRIDSIRGQIRATFEHVPDLPLSKVIIDMQGGKKGLLVNSRGICDGAFRSVVKMQAHNGKTRNTRPLLRNSKCGKARKGKRASKRRR